jgi:hypothetical protein
MHALVVDASIALAWALPDESSAYAEAALTVVEQNGLRVPEIWPREIANGLAVAYLRKRSCSACLVTATWASGRHRQPDSFKLQKALAVPWDPSSFSTIRQIHPGIPPHWSIMTPGAVRPIGVPWNGQSLLVVCLHLPS